MIDETAKNLGGTIQVSDISRRVLKALQKERHLPALDIEEER